VHLVLVCDIWCVGCGGSGPIGSGKTSTLYRYTQALGNTVLETGAGHDRRGKTIATKYEEATQSHRIKSTSRPFSPPPPGSPSGHSPTIDVDQADELASAAQPSSAASDAVLLFEEVDITLEPDAGFGAALVSLIASSKRPIVLTANGSYELPRAVAAAAGRRRRRG